MLDVFVVGTLYASWLFLALSAVGFARREAPSPGVSWRADPWRLALAGLFLGGLLLRLLLATWGPGDFYVRQSEGFLPVTGPTFRGMAPATLARLLFLVLPESDRTLVLVSAGFGAAAPVLLAALFRRVGASRTHAFAAGLLLAIHPLAVRYSGDLSRQAIALFLGLASLASLAAYRAERRWWQLAASLAAAWLCVRSRPESAVIIPYLWALLVVVIVRGRRELRTWWFRTMLTALLGLTLYVVAFYLWWAGRDLATEQAASMAGNPEQFSGLEYSAVWAADIYNPSLLIGLVFVGALRGLLARSRWALWAALCLAGGTFVLAHSVTAGELPQLANARYQTQLLPPASVLAAYGLFWIGDLLRGFRWRRVRVLRYVPEIVLAALLLIGGIPRLLSVTAPRTIDLEYAFLRRTLPTLPPKARIYLTFPPGETFTGGLQDPPSVALAVGRRDLRWLNWPPRPEDGEGPAFFYRSASCSTERAGDPYGAVSDGRFAACDEAVVRSGGRPLVEAALPWGSFRGEHYDVVPVPVGFYEIPAD